MTKLMRQAAAELPEPVAMGDVIAWFRKNFPKIKDSTVRAHVVAMTANNPNREHYRIRLGGQGPAWFRTPQGQLVRFDADQHLDAGSNGEIEGPVAEDPVSP